jgi:hypothetical protein
LKHRYDIVGVEIDDTHGRILKVEVAEPLEFYLRTFSPIQIYFASIAKGVPLNYLKGFIAGIATSILGPFLVTVAYIVWTIHNTPARNVGGRDNATSWDLRSAATPQFLMTFAVVVLIFFGIGFWIVFRSGQGTPRSKLR